MAISETVLAVFFLTLFEQKVGKNIANKKEKDTNCLDIFTFQETHFCLDTSKPEIPQ